MASLVAGDTCSAGDVFCSAALQPLFRQGGDGGVHVTLQHPFVGDGGLLRLLETMQLDMAQEQRHHGLPAQDQAWVVLVRCALELIPQRRGEGVGFGVIPEAIGSFRGLVALFEVEVQALGCQSPRCRPLVGVLFFWMVGL